jgi:hypothetical protein
MELDADNVIDLSDSSNEDVPLRKVAIRDSSPLFPSASYVTSSPSRSVPLTFLLLSTSIPPQPIVQCLCRFGSMAGIKNVLKKLK